MTHVLVLLALLLGIPDTPEPGGGSHPPADRVHSMTEADVDSLTPTTGALLPVLVVALEPQLSERSNRDGFLRGFEGAFGEGAFPTERVARRTGAVRTAAPLRNRFRLGEVDEEPAAWTARVKVEWVVPAPDSAAARDSLARAYPGLGARVAFEVQEPGDARPGARPLPHTESLRFSVGHPVDAAYYRHAGRQVAFLVLEALHRAQGLLNDDQRVRLENTRRAAGAAAR
jgi:hypothetical protein